MFDMPNLHKSTEPRWVVIPNGFGVPESLQDGVCLQYLLLHPGGYVGRHAEILFIGFD